MVEMDGASTWTELLVATGWKRTRAGRCQSLRACGPDEWAAVRAAGLSKAAEAFEKVSYFVKQIDVPEEAGVGQLPA